MIELLIDQLAELLRKSVQLSFPELENVEIKLEYPPDQTNGDYACNVAMRLSKQLGKNPREIAETIIANIDDDKFIDRIQIAGPGFINIYVREAVFKKTVAEILETGEQYGKSQYGDGKTVIVEYSQPNIAKPLGVHHLLSTIIGQSIYNLHKELGYDAISINYIGDWGTQFGKLIYAYKQWGDRETIEKDPINELLKLYVKFHDEAEKNPELEDRGRHEFNIFEQGDEENQKLWKWFVDESMKAVQATYEKLGGIHFDYIQGESFVEDRLAATLEAGKKSGVFVEGEEGAYVVMYEDENIPPFIVQKKDGATLYSTRDFATLEYRIEHWNPERIVYVVDVAQSLHFKQLFEAAKRFPWYGDQAVHVSFGRMQMKDSRMSTRKGNIVLLDEVLDEAEKRALDLIEEKSPYLKGKEATARAVGVGAVKYSVLSQNRNTNIVFDWDKMLSLEGNSAPYLQYTYARGRSILRKVGDFEGSVESTTDPENIEEKVWGLMALLPRFEDQIIMAAKEYKPNILCNYLYQLAQSFNSFYNSVPVLKVADEKVKKERLDLVNAATTILKNGLSLLGIEVVEEM